MTSTSSGSNSRSSTTNTHGSLTMLFRFECAALVLMDYDKEGTLRFLRTGEFMVSLVMQGCLMMMMDGHDSIDHLDQTAVMMCACMVGGLQWPLAKDYPIIRVGQQTFVFAMPGLLYGLQFPPSCNSHLVDTLVERVFIKFGHYIELNQNGLSGYPFPDNEPNIWQSIRAKIEQIAHATLFQLGHIPGRSPSSIANQVSGMLRVIRMSATSKFIGNIILSGSLKAIHVHIQDITGTERPKPADGSFVDCGRHHKTAAYSSISVFTDLVEAVEIAMAVADGHSHLLEEKIPAAVLVGSSSSPPPPRGFKAWRLNKQGIIAYMEALRSASEVEQMKMNDSLETQG